MHYFMLVKVVKSYNQLSRKKEICFKRRWPEIFIELFESTSDILHEDQSLFREEIMLNISDYIFM